ncbi:MAG: retropepsin-like aspartic protease family protein [Allosphingosinicella sp.]
MKTRSLLLTLLGGLALAFSAQAQEAPSLDELFRAADRGDVAPMEQALAQAPSDDVRALLRARLAAGRFDPAAARDPVLARLTETGADPAQRRAALAIVTSVAFGAGDYAEAARVAGLLEQALAANGDSEEAQAVGRTRAVAALLAGHPRQTVEGSIVPAAIPVAYDRVGLPRIHVSVNGQAQEAVVDTGANLSVLSRDTARRLGVEILDAQANVANGVDGTVPVRIGIADRVEIAGTVFRHVSFLIIDDEQLTFPLPGGYDIRSIVGLPVLRALERVRIDHEGHFAVLAPGARSDAPSNLRASGNDLFVDVIVDGRPAPLHLDTGANETSLSARYAEAHPDVVAGLETSERNLASAGGARRARIARWRQAPLTLAGRSLVLPELPLGLPGDGPEPRFYGTLGSNALRAFTSYTIDFEAMRLELGPPVAAPAS